MKISPYSHLASLFEVSLTQAVNELKPERAFVAYRSRDNKSAEFPTPYATQKFDMARLFVDEDISTELVRITLREGQPQLIVDAISTPGLTNSTSVILSGLRSVLTVPLRLSNGLTVGLFYVDNRVVTGAFKEPHLERLSEIAAETMGHLSSIEQKMREAPTDIVLHDPFPDVRQAALSAAERGSFTEGLAKIEQWIRGRADSVDLGLGYGVKGRILQQMGNLDSALEAVAVAVYILGNLAVGTQGEHYPIVLNNLAGLHVEKENYHRAHGLFEAAEACWNRLCRNEQKHLGGLAGTQYNLGKMFQEMGDPRAVGWFEKALTTSEQAFGADHPRTLKVREALSAILS